MDMGQWRYKPTKLWGSLGGKIVFKKMGKPTILRFERNCWMENCRTPMDCTPKCGAFLYH